MTEGSAMHTDTAELAQIRSTLASQGELVSWCDGCRQSCLVFPCQATSVEGVAEFPPVDVPRDYEDAQEQAMQAYIQEALEAGIIRPSTSPASARFFFVAALERIHGATIFTKLDLRSAYNLIRIRKGVFQAFVNHALADFINCFVLLYLDDSLVFSRTQEEHIEQGRSWWPSLSDDVRDYVEACTLCSQAWSPTLKPTGLLEPLLVPSPPWTHIAINFLVDLPVSESKTMILTMLDRFYKSCHLIPLPKLPSALETAKIVFHQSKGLALNGGPPVETPLEEAEPVELSDGGAERNWKGIAISLLVIIVVLSLIGLAIVLLSKENGATFLGSPLSLDDLFRRDFQVHDPEAKWINDEEIVYRNKDGDIVKIKLKSSEAEILMKNTTFAMFKASKFAISPDLNFVLLAYDVKQVFQHSFLASYLMYNLRTREVVELNPPEVSDSVLQYASWGVRDQQLVYIFENNIYYQAEVKMSSLRLTSSGREGVIFNGIADWLYEEELLHTHVAHWLAPNGARLAYLAINDTLVPNMILPRFTGALYPKGQQYPYPKVGQINPVVSLYIVTLDEVSQTIEVIPPVCFQKSEYYIAMVKWVTNEKISVRWLNRAQNTSILTVCEVSTGECLKKQVMTSDTWLDRQDEVPVFSQDGKTLFLTMPVESGDQGAFNHIAMLSDQAESETVNIQYLTSGSWEVTQIMAYDESANAVYFLSTEGNSSQRHLYRVSAGKPFQRKCVTCDLHKQQCSYYSAVFSLNIQSMILTCRGPDVPRTSVYRLSDLSSNLTLENNRDLKQALKDRKAPRREIRTLEMKNYAFRMELNFPSDFEENKLYPLLLIVRSAPGIQSVGDWFQLHWESVLISADSVIVARLDGRGSRFQGQRVLQAIHRHLGITDVEDHIVAVQSLVKLPYIDGSRVGVYGKGYGGFLATLLLLSSDTLFKCGVAVAPVVDWKLYGSAFTERYFGFPTKKAYKYQIFSLLPNMTRTYQHKFLIMHGTADATVHFQHSAELVKLLSTLNINYTLQIFPDEGHEIISTRSRYYMLTSVVTFFRECFQEVFPVTKDTKEGQ
ncbi:inactive dipeptidyl peptidase 10-like [Scleropages formosus]|uniref:inactive dipeptidyl peptidase 10-like n=1 Tax=Scleropages formosus TaxID=113540 RepID=UPI0010FAB696|nr:inactive dipeptidyl peptidase 10-like [Scleropages formosus]